MVLLITIVFNLFSLFCCETFSFAVKLFLLSWDFFLLLWYFFFYRETLSFAVRLFLFLWHFFFCRETFYFPVRLFILQWDFFFVVRLFLLLSDFLFPRETFYFPRENVSSENYFTQSENFFSSIKEGFGRLCSLCLVLWARHFYNLEKEEVKRAKRLL